MREWQREVVETLEAKGHRLQRYDDGEIDWFMVDVDVGGGHNGPGCVKCDESWCVHCLGVPGALEAVKDCTVGE